MCDLRYFLIMTSQALLRGTHGVSNDQERGSVFNM